MAELTSMCNVGKELARKLESVGIRSAEELTRTGSMEAFLRLKIRYPNVCLVHLYALQDAFWADRRMDMGPGERMELPV